jgi:transcription elongation factor Elf1
MLQTTQYKYHMRGFKPCPMCGSIQIRVESYYGAGACYVMCRKCGLSLPLDIEALLGEDVNNYHDRCMVVARPKWNHRATEVCDDVEDDM